MLRIKGGSRTPAGPYRAEKSGQSPLSFLFSWFHGRKTTVGVFWMMAVPLQAQTALQLNTYYACNGQRIVVRSCVDNSAKPYNDCVVQLPDRPALRNGQPASTFVLHSSLMNILKTCRVLAPASAGMQSSASILITDAS